MHELLSITDRYIKGPLCEFCNNRIGVWTHRRHTTGYLRLWSFSDYSKGGDFERGEKALVARWMKSSSTINSQFEFENMTNSRWI
jgi:hypothetical protein